MFARCIHTSTHCLFALVVPPLTEVTSPHTHTHTHLFKQLMCFWVRLMNSLAPQQTAPKTVGDQAEPSHLIWPDMVLNDHS